MSHSRPLPPPPSDRGVSRYSHCPPCLSVACLKPLLLEMLAATPARAYLGHRGEARVSVYRSPSSQDTPQPEGVQNAGIDNGRSIEQRAVRRASLAVTVKRDSITATIAEFQDMVSISSAMPAHMTVENGRQATSHRLKCHLEAVAQGIVEAVGSAWLKGSGIPESPSGVVFTPPPKSLVSPSETSTFFDPGEDEPTDLHQVTGQIGYLSEDQDSVAALSAGVLVDLVDLAQETMRRRFFDHVVSHSEFDSACSVCDELFNKGYFFKRMVVTF
ncbi:hypothetical protein BKA70DRAFT_1443449 [Coprinopsis sp. MPI-PUGE-AT-0042]|nr:hypothetical protein BKA70DRAFT_1443449 [Coprinopsis sp. MPI-PUGE-AT-0042]